MGYISIAGLQTIADDRRRSQKIEHGSIVCGHDCRIAGDRRSVFPYDRRTFCDLRSAMFKASKRCYNRTFGLYGLKTLNHWSELKILWDKFRLQDCKQSQTIAEDRTWFYLLRSCAVTIAGSEAIAGDRRSVFPYDRRRSQNFLRSAIVCDHMETSLYTPEKLPAMHMKSIQNAF